MYRGTTPEIIITLPESVDVSDITAAYLTFTQRPSLQFTKELSAMTIDAVANTVMVRLTQEETLQFNENQNLSFQLRFIADGNAYATQIFTEPAGRILKDGAI